MTWNFLQSFPLSGAPVVQSYRSSSYESNTSQEPLNAPLLVGCLPVDFQEAKRPLRTKSGKRPIKVGKRPIKEGKRPIKPMMLVGISIGCLMGCFRAPPPWRTTAPPITSKGSIEPFASNPPPPFQVALLFETFPYL